MATHETDGSIHDQINALVAQEHDLRTRLGQGEITTQDEHAQLGKVEEQLDRLWDLLRQRQARRDSGHNPDEAQIRSGNVVEDYLS